MGCGSPREQLENKMLAYKLERFEIQMEKQKELKKLAEIEGHCIERAKVLDYIDPLFAREKKIYIESNGGDKSKKNEDKEKNKKKLIKTKILQKKDKKDKKLNIKI